MTLVRWLLVAGAFLLVLAASTAPTALAQDMDKIGLGPVLSQIKGTRTVRVGYRASSPPFSFLDGAGHPIGYSLELCSAIVDEIGREVDEPAKETDVRIIPGLKIEYVAVTPETRIPMLVDRKIDLECGSTTANAERARQVAFSPLIFVAGTRLLVPRAAGVHSIRDLKGKAIGVTRGTTNEKAIADAGAKFGLDIRIVTSADHEESFRMLAERKVDAFATDDILLYGLIARHQAQQQFEVVGDLLSYEPYGIMYSRDEPEMKEIVERTFRRMAEDGDLVPLYMKWFRARLPTGERLNVPMSRELEDSFSALGSTITRGN
jgi:glutamate/aspartate transport system substrate-binding protein